MKMKEFYRENRDNRDYGSVKEMEEGRKGCCQLTLTQQILNFVAELKGTSKTRVIDSK